MPLSLYRNISHDSSYAIWHITEEVSQLMALLPEFDREGLQPRHERARAEYAASRLVIKVLCEKSDITYEGITKDKHNKPHLKGQEAYVSISHSFPYAGAMVHRQTACGIDIERKREKVSTIAQKFVNEKEKHWVDGDITNLTILWSAKETLYKIYGRKRLAFKENMTVLPGANSNTSPLCGSVITETSEKTYNLGIERIEDFIITFLES